MHGNANIETRSQIKRRLCRFAKTVAVHDLRDSDDTRKARATRHERKNKTNSRHTKYAEGHMAYEARFS